jgi:hypothetical protein
MEGNRLLTPGICRQDGAAMVAVEALFDARV